MVCDFVLCSNFSFFDINYQNCCLFCWLGLGLERKSENVESNEIQPKLALYLHDSNVRVFVSESFK